MKKAQHEHEWLICVTADVWRALYLLAEAKTPGPNEGGRIVSVDSMADDLLQEVIKEKYPQLFEHQKQVRELEAELIKIL